MTAPTWNPTRVTLGSLRPWQDNPRLMKKAQAKRLLEGWGALGQFQTVAVGPGGEVYDGHQRLSALLSVHGAGYELAALQSDRALTDDERRRLVFAANAPAGQWDADKLASWDTAQVLEWAGVDAPAWADQKREVAMWGAMLESEDTDPAEEWEGMPEFDNQPKAARTIYVHFATMQDADNFAQFIGQKITEKTKSIWYPEAERIDKRGIVYENEP